MLAVLLAIDPIQQAEDKIGMDKKERTYFDQVVSFHIFPIAPKTDVDLCSRVDGDVVRRPLKRQILCQRNSPVVLKIQRIIH